MLEIENEVPHPCWSHGLAKFKWSFVHNLLICICAEGKDLRTNYALKAESSLQENLSMDSWTLKRMAENYIMCLHAAREE